MEREYLIKKWLNNDLSPLEHEAFESLDDYESLVRLSNYTKRFSAPEFAYEEALRGLDNKIEARTKKTRYGYKSFLKIAAVLALFFGIYYFTILRDTAFSVDAAEKITVTLPDHSTVDLNALSQISFNKNSWQSQRNVILDGEAFFKVAKGSAFDVYTTSGVVTVLGTQFNVKQRNDYFEVKCYEGLVQVTYNATKTKLQPGQSLTIWNHIPKIKTESKNKTNQPEWLNGISEFKSVPLRYVLSEFERQYGIKVISKEINVAQLFTGKFTHDDMTIAIKSIVQPLRVKYTKTNNKILLMYE